MKEKYRGQTEKGKMEHLWQEYYREFRYLTKENVRLGCHPRKLIHPGGAKKAVVLVHGLTDSPYFLTAIGDFFYHRLHYDVYLPLLQMHGLKDPQGMQGVSAGEWQKNVIFAIKEAATGGREVSIGGLSTGGALSLWAMLTEPRLIGRLYLFSAALGLADSFVVVPGWLKELFLRLPFIGTLDSNEPLIGRNPYRYTRVSLNSGAELVKLIRRNRRLLGEHGKARPLSAKIFCCWSECDAVVSRKAFVQLGLLAGSNNFVPFVVPRRCQVEHASVVLEQPVFATDAQRGDKPLEDANPQFTLMMNAMEAFSQLPA